VSEVEAISGRERKREPAAEILSEAKDLLREAEVGSSDRQSALIARPDGECELLSPRAPPTKARCTKDAELPRFADDGKLA